MPASPPASCRALRLGLLHGRLSPADKDMTMDLFRAGGLDVLVATTVIEVGVDVPNATVMVILDADRFGIAQLHQLRGRVGRGTHESQCWLVTADGRPEPSRRRDRGVDGRVRAGRGRPRAARRGHADEHGAEGAERPPAGVVASRPRARAAGPRRGVRDRRRRPRARRTTRCCSTSSPCCSATTTPSSSPAADECHPRFSRDPSVSCAPSGPETPPAPRNPRMVRTRRWRRRRGRGPSGRGSPRSGRRRCRRAATRLPRGPRDRCAGGVIRCARPAAVHARDDGIRFDHGPLTPRRPLQGTRRTSRTAHR